MDRLPGSSLTPEERTRIMELQMHQKLAQIQQIREREARERQERLAREHIPHVDQNPNRHQLSTSPGPVPSINRHPANSLTPEERTRIMEIQMHQKLAQIQQIREREAREREIWEREARERQERLAREAVLMVTNIVECFR
ncbi:hypothetical protein B9Z55_016712 [Caenorhabditis nigoni]|uniref:Uncharacterized protein n=1 Tax=Caenorhabditis nigoni TaxID=1611254 RepID=A0A2G5T6A8_9PELO|nr:hypothetical protein B9Z55_016712 [Caenorhabditis nigoni]